MKLKHSEECNDMNDRSAFEICICTPSHPAYFENLNLVYTDLGWVSADDPMLQEVEV